MLDAYEEDLLIEALQERERCLVRNLDPKHKQLLQKAGLRSCERDDEIDAIMQEDLQACRRLLQKIKTGKVQNGVHEEEKV